jgi:hypothetical protein
MSLLLAQMTSIRAENKRVLEMNRHARTPRPADNIIPIARGRRAG